MHESFQDLTDRLSQNVGEFCDWWIKGLRAPWGSARTDTIVLGTDGERVGKVSFDPSNKIVISPARVSESPVVNKTLLDKDSDYSSAKIYLMMPLDKVIITTIEPAQKNLHAIDIALESLPFSADEIVASVNATQTRLFSVLKKELKQEVQRMEQMLSVGVNGVPVPTPELSGVAFADAPNWLTADIADMSEFGERAAAQPGSDDSIDGAKHGFGRRWRAIEKSFAACAALLLVVIVTLLFATNSAKQGLVGLQEELELLGTTELRRAEDFQQARLTSKDLAEQLATYRASTNSPEQSLVWLKSLVQRLRADIEVSQLILTQNEMLIDAVGTDAAAFQLTLSRSDEFNKVEFVSGIARDSLADKERFRLRIVLRDTLAEAPNGGDL